MNINIRSIKLLLIIILMFHTILKGYSQIEVTAKPATCGKANGSAKVSVKGGTEPYTYLWTNGSTAPSVEDLAPNTEIGVTVTDANGCSGKDSDYVDNIDKDCKKDSCTDCDASTVVFAGADPNDITGPTGYSLQRWVSVNDELLYTIRFENDPKIATASVTKVIVTHPIDRNADMLTFHLGDISFRNFNVPVPPNTYYFSKRLNLVDSIGVIIDITAGLNVTKKEVIWIFQAFDPNTGLPNTNPFLGFLAINDSLTHQGEGKVCFSIKPKKAANTGDTIKAFSSIVFDVNEPILTNTEYNTIDAHPPISEITSIADRDINSIEIYWKGNDDLHGSGISDYKLYIYENNQLNNIKQLGVSDTSAIVNVNPGNRYKFMTIATDNVLNKENLKENGDSIIKVIPKKFFITPNHLNKFCVGSQIKVKWDSINIDNYNLEISADSGKTFSSIEKYIFITDSAFYWEIPKNIVGNKYYIMRAINSYNNLPIDTSEYFLIKNNIVVNAGLDKDICEGDSIVLGGFPVVINGEEPYTYLWETDEQLSDMSSSNPYTYIDGEYIITVKDMLGCIDSDTVIVRSHSIPYVRINNFSINYCYESINDTLSGFPMGGTFIGAGIDDNIFNPFKAGIGSHLLEYKYTDNNGCSNSFIDTVIVNSLPQINFMGLNNTYCKDYSIIELEAIPTGGSFSGNGVDVNEFIPFIAGIGNHSITYSVVNENGCINSQSQTVTVIDLPSISIVGLDTKYCINSDTTTLIATPTGGILTGNGIEGNKFIPAKAGVGIHQITYSYTDPNGGCSNSKTQQVEVIGLPNLTISGLDTIYCLSASPVTLTGTPANGVFSGNGITGNSFNPSLAGIGSHSITYTYTDLNGCSNSMISNVKVYGTPNVSFAGLSTSYCLNSGSALLVGSPSGGTFIGNGISGNSFSPLAAGAGAHQVTYMYTDMNACSSTQIQSVVVNSLPSVSFSGLDTSYCVNSGLISLTGKPTGGIFSGNGITGSKFNTSIAGIGKHTITYSYTDGNGCSKDSFMFVRVNSLPTISLGNDISITTVESTILNAGNGFKSYLWSDGSAGQTLTLDGAILGKGTHKVWVEVSDNNSCAAADTILIKVSDNVGIDIFNSLVKLQVYPNPSNGLFNLEIENSSSENIHVEIRSASGQLVYSKKFKGRYEDIKTEINLIDKAKGVYFLNVKVKREQITRKIVII